MDLSAGAPAQVEVILGLGVGEVSGMVRDAKQQPASGAMVTLLPDPMKEDRNDLYKMVSTGQSGRFTLQGMAPASTRHSPGKKSTPAATQTPSS